MKDWHTENTISHTNSYVDFDVKGDWINEATKWLQKSSQFVSWFLSSNLFMLTSTLILNYTRLILYLYGPQEDPNLGWDFLRLRKSVTYLNVGKFTNCILRRF